MANGDPNYDDYNPRTGEFHRGAYQGDRHTDFFSDPSEFRLRDQDTPPELMVLMYDHAIRCDQFVGFVELVPVDIMQVGFRCRCGWTRMIDSDRIGHYDARTNRFSRDRFDDGMRHINSLAKSNASNGIEDSLFCAAKGLGVPSNKSVTPVEEFVCENSIGYLDIE